MTDFLDEILDPQKQPDASGNGHYLVVGVRAKSSAEIEAREAEYVTTAWLPIPFFKEDGTMEDLSKKDVAVLKEMDLTPDEYRVLVGAMTIDEYEQQMELETS